MIRKSVPYNPSLDGGVRIGSGGARVLRVLTGTGTWNPPDLATGAQATNTITVTGAAVGDPVFVGFGANLNAMRLTGYVSAANSVTAVLKNDTGGNLNLGSATLRAVVFQF